MSPGAGDTSLPPTLSRAPARHPMPGEGPPCLPPQGREGSSQQRCPLEERAAPLPAAHPSSAVPPLPSFPAQGPYRSGGLSLPPQGPFFQCPMLGWDLRLLPLALPTHPAVLLLPTIRLAPKRRVPPDEGLPGLSRGPLSPGSGGGPPQPTSGQLPPSNPIQEPVPAGLEMLYI